VQRGPRRASPGIDHPPGPAEEPVVEAPRELRDGLDRACQAEIQAAEIQAPRELGHEQAVVAGQAPRAHRAVVHQVEDVNASEQDGLGQLSLDKRFVC
jgi:hypothetical protein